MCDAVVHEPGPGLFGLWSSKSSLLLGFEWIRDDLRLALVWQIVEHQPAALPPETPADIVQIIRGLLQKDPCCSQMVLEEMWRQPSMHGASLCLQ